MNGLKKVYKFKLKHPQLYSPMESISLAHIACFITFIEPIVTLLRSPMRKRIGNDMPLRLLLQPVVPGRSHRRLTDFRR
jgi:hypothetical protein